MKHCYLIILILFLSGCVTTKATGFIDPEYKKKGYQVSKVVVRIKNATLEETQIAEQMLAEKFNSHGVAVVKFTEIAPPTRNFTPKEEAKLLKKSGADSVFIIYAGNEGRGIAETYVPLTYHPGQTRSQVNVIGNTSYVQTHTTPGYTTGGYSVSQPVMACLVSLIDLKNGNQIWKAETISDGGSDNSFSDLIVSAGESAMEDMKAKGLLK